MPVLWLPRGTGEPLPRVFWFLWLGTLINRLGTFVLPFLTLFLTLHRGLDPATATLIVGFYGAGGFAASLLGGVATDRLGRRATLILSLSSGAALTLAVPLISSPLGLGIVVGLLGLGAEAYRPAVAAAVADLVPPGSRLRAYTFLYWATNLGAALAPVLGGLIAARSYGALFVGDATTMALYALVVRLRVPETRPDAMAQRAAGGQAQPTTGRPAGLATLAPATSGTTAQPNTALLAGPSRFPAAPAARSRLAGALGDPLLAGLTLCCLAFASLFTQAYTTLPLSMTAAGLNETSYGLAIALNGAVVVLLSLPVAAFVQRFQRLPAMAAAALLTGFGVFLHGPADSTLGYAGAIAVWTLGEIVLAPLAPALVADLAPEHSRGIYQGIFSSAWSGAHFVGPVLGGLVLQRWGEAVLWPACLAVALVAAAGFLTLAPAARRRLARP